MRMTSAPDIIRFEVRKRKMKKIASFIIASAMLVCAASTSVGAASVNEGSAGSLSTAFTFEYKNDPAYTVSIPAAVTMTKEGSEVEITAENVADLDGKRISVTIAGTDKYRNQMLLEGKTAEGRNASLRYQFIMPDETVIETTGGKDQVNGAELASFTEDGSVSFTVKPVLSASSATVKGVTYTGSITYGIGLAD